ncbi:MAG TPA: DUF3565 domain-containing protein [Gammaproteobacteria bacterium]
MAPHESRGSVVAAHVNGSGATALGDTVAVARRIVGFHVDDSGDWVAQLECGHNQHVRHNPPWVSRPWVVSPEGRAAMIGQMLQCPKCAAGAPPDPRPAS